MCVTLMVLVWVTMCTAQICVLVTDAGNTIFDELYIIMCIMYHYAEEESMFFLDHFRIWVFLVLWKRWDIKKGEK